MRCFPAELCDELGRCAGQVEMDLPHVDFQVVLPGRSQALGDLVAVAAKRVARRQNVAGVVGLAAPEHVGQDHIEAVAGQLAGRTVPVARIGPRARMVPHGAAFRAAARAGPRR